MSRFAVDYYKKMSGDYVVICFFLWFLSSCCLWFLQPALLDGIYLSVLVENFRNAPLNRKPLDTRPRLLQTELLLLISVSIRSKEAYRPNNKVKPHREPNESPLMFREHGG